MSRSRRSSRRCRAEGHRRRAVRMRNGQPWMVCEACGAFLTSMSAPDSLDEHARLEQRVGEGSRVAEVVGESSTQRVERLGRDHHHVHALTEL